MNGFAMGICVVGVGTMASLITRLIVWLDAPKKNHRSK